MDIEWRNTLSWDIGPGHFVLLPHTDCFEVMCSDILPCQNKELE